MKSYCTIPGIGFGIGCVVGTDASVGKMLQFYVKFFMCWARRCQVSYSVCGQVLFVFKTSFKIKCKAHQAIPKLLRGWDWGSGDHCIFL